VVFDCYLCIIKSLEDISFSKENFELLIKKTREQSIRISELKQELEWLKRQIFGRKSERFEGMDPNQLQLQLDELQEQIRQQ
jgi:hypothetical protein